MNNRVRTDLGDLLILLVDLMLLVLASNTAYYVIYSNSITSLIWQPFVRTIPVMGLLYIVMMGAYGLWNPIKLAYSEMLYSVFLTVATLWVTTMGMTFIFRDFAYPRYVFFLGFFLQLLFLSIWRTIVFRILEVEHGKKNLLIIGRNDVRDIAKKTIETFPRLYCLKYIADYRCENLRTYIEDADVVFLCEEIEGEAKIELVDRLMNMRKSVYVVPRNYEINLLRANVQRIEDKPVVKLHKLELTIEQRFFKRIVDILISVAGLLIFAPVFLLVAYKIKAHDGGPVFYSQDRMTRGNEVFSILKFRSMVVDAE
ncbi:MAG TPA: sugar transferase, partial [Clostridiaceae bacterium]|nr:sugar transferase [Clostridiaceae bacterium]